MDVFESLRATACPLCAMAPCCAHSMVTDADSKLPCIAMMLCSTWQAAVCQIADVFMSWSEFYGLATVIHSSYQSMSKLQRSARSCSPEHFFGESIQECPPASKWDGSKEGNRYRTVQRVYFPTTEQQHLNNSRSIDHITSNHWLETPRHNLKRFYPPKFCFSELIRIKLLRKTVPMSPSECKRCMCFCICVCRGGWCKIFLTDKREDVQKKKFGNLWIISTWFYQAILSG